MDNLEQINSKYKIINNHYRGILSVNIECNKDNNICITNNKNQLTINIDNEYIIFYVEQIEYMNNDKLKMKVNNIIKSDNFPVSIFNEYKILGILNIPTILYLTRHDNMDNYWYLRNINYVSMLTLSIIY